MDSPECLGGKVSSRSMNDTFFVRFPHLLALFYRRQVVDADAKFLAEALPCSQVPTEIDAPQMYFKFCLKTFSAVDFPLCRIFAPALDASQTFEFIVDRGGGVLLEVGILIKKF